MLQFLALLVGLLAVVPTVSQSRISFGSARVGQTAGPLCFTITNNSSAPLSLNSISVSNCSSSNSPTYVDCATLAGFQIISGGTPGVLQPSQSRDVCLTFTPGQAATFDSTVTINTNAPSSPTVVSLHGTGEPVPPLAPVVSPPPPVAGPPPVPMPAVVTPALPAPTLHQSVRLLIIGLPVIPKGRPWLHFYQDGVDKGGYWHLEGWSATPVTGPDYDKIIIYLSRPPKPQLLALEVERPSYSFIATKTALYEMTLSASPPGTAANRDSGLQALWALCEGQ